MSIASGYKKFKKYILTSSGFQLVSHWTKANTLEFDDGKTAQDKLGAIDGISSSRESNSDKIAASTALVSELNSDLGGFSFKEEFGIKYVRGADSVWVPLGSVSSHLVTNKNTITGLVPGKECYIYVIAYWQARGIAAENKPWQLNVSGAENISVLHANYRNLYGEAGGTDAWAVLNVKSTADTITVVSLNQSINQWPMVCVVQ